MFSIKDSNLLLNHIVNYSWDEVFVTDASGNVIMASARFQDLFGIDTKKIINQNVKTLEKTGVLSPSVTRKVLETKKTETTVQDTGAAKIIVSAYPIFDENQELWGTLSYSRDITELESLRKSNDQVAKTLQLYEEQIKKMRNQKFQAVVSAKMKKVFQITEKVSNLDVTVLLEGESGVGKNYIAQMIHRQSERRNEPFIEVNCGAIVESLIESELFGYEEGAFTGAKKGGKEGFFEAAGNGTIFLDEIAELPLSLQVKLLFVLQNMTIQRVGGRSTIKLNCRIICATNQDLQQLVLEKQFREDLYYRINVINIPIPPLRERREEIIPLIYDLIREFNHKHQKNKRFAADTVSWLSRQDWPGNIRELRNYIERLVITSSEDLVDIKQEEMSVSLDTEVNLETYMEMMEGDYIRRMYRKYPSSIKLAKKLGISQSTANRKINKYI